MFQTGYTGPFHGHPVVYRGVMYVTAATSTMGIDAATCEPK